MRPSLRRSPAWDALACGLFICALFYGDLYFGITMPLVVVLLPLVVLLRLPTLLQRRPKIPAGLLLLSATAVSVGIQALRGYGPRGKADLVVYLPFLYAAVAMVVLAGARMPDRYLRRSFVAGGVLCAALLIGTIAFAPRYFYFVPGQNPVRIIQHQEAIDVLARARAAAAGQSPPASSKPSTNPRGHADAASEEAAGAEVWYVTRDGGKTWQKEVKARSRAATPSGTAAAPTPDATVFRELSPAMKFYYMLKFRAMTPLGLSNYVAVMFVFLFNVMLYQRSRWAILFAVLVFVTLSRTGMGFLFISLALWLAYRLGRIRELVVAGAAAAVIVTIAMTFFWGKVNALPGAESLGARMFYLATSWDPISAHPIAGTPRSEVIRRFGYPLAWNPHSSILHLLVLFGIIGTAAYIAYVTVAMTAMLRRARESQLWTGLTAAMSITLLWSLIEIIVLSPAFELLLASLYSFAHSHGEEADSAGA